MEWCWQVPESAKLKIYSGGYLFSALYRFFRFTYHGNGISIAPEVALPKEFIDRFVALPLDLQRDITNRIWNQGKGYRRVIVKDNSPVLPLSLWFLFCVYGRLRSVTSKVVPQLTVRGKEPKCPGRSINLCSEDQITEPHLLYPISWIGILYILTQLILE
jgi:hypothetical protein